MDLSALQSIVNTANANSIAKAATAQAQDSGNASQTTSGQDSYDSQLQAIAQKYDITHMTPQQVEQMAYELNEKGLISVGDFGVLALTPYLVATGDEATMRAVGPDGNINLLDYWKETITPSFAASGEALFSKLIADRQEAAGTSKAATTNAVAGTLASLPATYRESIDNATRDYQRVTTLLEALAAHNGTAQQ